VTTPADDVVLWLSDTVMPIQTVAAMAATLGFAFLAVRFVRSLGRAL